MNSKLLGIIVAGQHKLDGHPTNNIKGIIITNLILFEARCPLTVKNAKSKNSYTKTMQIRNDYFQCCKI